MTSRSRSSSRVEQAAVLLLLPAIAAHELTHALAAWPFASSIELASRVPPRLRISYPSGTPVRAIQAVNLAPTLVGVALLPAVVLFLMSTELPPPLLYYVIGSFGLFAWPSGDDLNGWKRAVA